MPVADASLFVKFLKSNSMSEKKLALQFIWKAWRALMTAPIFRDFNSAACSSQGSIPIAYA